jgi:hypothetical protein
MCSAYMPRVAQKMVLMKADGTHILWLHICHRWCPIHEALVWKVVRLHEPEDPVQVRGLERAGLFRRETFSFPLPRQSGGL